MNWIAEVEFAELVALGQSTVNLRIAHDVLLPLVVVEIDHLAKPLGALEPIARIGTRLAT